MKYPRLLKISTLILISFVFIPAYCQSLDSTQSTKKYWSIDAFYQLGKVLPTNKFVKGVNANADEIDDFQALSVQLTYQTNGKHLWERAYNFPRWGGGLYVGDFFDKVEIGYPIALYGFFVAPFKRWPKSSINYKLGFGFTFNWEAYNASDNRYNIATGAGETVYIDLGMHYEYNFTGRLSADVGFSLSHFSNGALKKPNFGFNTLAPRLRLRYDLQDARPVSSRQMIAAYDKHFEYNFSVFVGTKQVFFDTANVELKKKYSGVYFPIFGISAVANYQVFYKSKLGAGITFAYNGTVNAQLDVQDGEVDEIEVPFTDHVAVSIYPSYELVVNRMSLILQPGFYVIRKRIPGKDTWVYYRIGLKCHISEQLFAGINLRANSLKESDFIEWSVGYRLIRKH